MDVYSCLHQLLYDLRFQDGPLRARNEPSDQRNRNTFARDTKELGMFPGYLLSVT